MTHPMKTYAIRSSAIPKPDDVAEDKIKINYQIF